MSAGKEYGDRAVMVESAAAVFPVGGSGLRMRQSADHTQLIPERLERLQDFRKLKALSLSGGSPKIHGGPVRNIDARQPALWACCGFAQGRLRRYHRFQERQGHGNTRTAKECAAGKEFFCDEHGSSPSVVEEGVSFLNRKSGRS